ncbi:hypothetical protein BGZ46_003260, partial [Entomortierella lignicola]
LHTPWSWRRRWQRCSWSLKILEDPRGDKNIITLHVIVRPNRTYPTVRIFGGELVHVPERPLRGRHGHGKVDYAIESLTKDGTRHVLGVTEVKQEDYRRGPAQNIVQLESSLAVRKHKRSNDDYGEEDKEEDSSAPLKAYGVVTDASVWYFVEYSNDQSQDRPKFRISRLVGIINYNNKETESQGRVSI